LYPGNYATDFRPPFQDGESWEFEVATNINEKVNLIFGSIESVPSDFEIWLVDEVANISYNLRQQNHYSFASLGEGKAKRFQLIVGKRDFINENFQDNQLVPNKIELYQNFPNPFNPATTIRYGLPNNRKVTLKIFNLLGEEVITLINDEEKFAGYHAAVWDGRNTEGLAAASGIYIYHIRAGGFSTSWKMLLLK